MVGQLGLMCYIKNNLTWWVFMMFKLLSSLVLFYAFGLHAVNTITDEATGLAFPDEVSFNYLEKSYQLQATGVAVRKKLFFNIYSIAHYTQKGAPSKGDKFQDIINDGHAHQLTIKWARDVDALDIQEGFEEALKNGMSGPTRSKLKSAIISFVAMFSRSTVEGEEHVIRLVPEGIIEVFVNGKAVGKITNPDLAKGVWNMWFGPESVVNREDLVALMK